MNYEAIRKSAAATIKKNGKAIKIIVSGGTTYKPAEGTETAGVDPEYPGRAVELNYTQKERDGSMIRANDRRFLVAGLQDNGAAMGQMATGQRIEVSGDTLEIVSVNPLNPGEVNIIYEVQARS